MPESAAGDASSSALPPPAALKCAMCGAASLGPVDGVIILGEQIERVCTACVSEARGAGARDLASPDVGHASGLAVDVELSSVAHRDSNSGEGSSGTSPTSPISPISEAANGLGLSALAISPTRSRGPSSRSPSPPVVLDLARLREVRDARERDGRRRDDQTGAVIGAATADSASSAARTSASDGSSSPVQTTVEQMQSQTPTETQTQTPHAPSQEPRAPAAQPAASKIDYASAVRGARAGPKSPPCAWATLPSPLAPAPSAISAPSASASGSSGPSGTASPARTDEACNPLMDVGRTRLRSQARGCLYPGSVFRGSQTSGRSAYDVEVTLVDVNFAASTLCGYLSISHLTESHPHLTTFFDGEIIGPKYGFITGARYGATKDDDMLHWNRFDQFRRPATRADMVRPEMLLRDPVPDTHPQRGEKTHRERDFVFLRIKEKFLVPDHHVRDISGASFAGFYYVMVDLSPTLQVASPPPSPVVPKSPLAARRQSSSDARPDSPRRGSSSVPLGDGMGRRTSTSAAMGRPDTPRRQSSSRPPAPSKDATMRGYYFHSIKHKREPFQELTLVHVPSTSRGTFELR